MRTTVLDCVFALALATGAVAAGHAVAADMPLKAPAPAVTWSGFYIGGDSGAAWLREPATWYPLPSPTVFGSYPIASTLQNVGVDFGVHAGFNLQITPAALVGIEGDWSRATLSDSFTKPWVNVGSGLPNLSQTTTMTTSLNWLSSIRGRIGALVTPSTLVYATGGFAWGDFDHSAANSNGLNPPVDYRTAVSLSGVQNGFVVGGGLERMLASNWLVRVQYLYYRFGSGPNVLATTPVFPLSPSNYVWGRPELNVVEIGLSYKFGGPPSVEP